MLGEDWQDIQSVWLHRLGNLTLTGYNSTYSDRPFRDKKTIRGGFEESSVRLNKLYENKFNGQRSRWSSAEQILFSAHLLFGLHWSSTPH